MLCDGELVLAKILRRKVLEKCEFWQRNSAAPPMKLSTYTLPPAGKPPTLLDFEGKEIAEQMTLLDSG